MFFSTNSYSFPAVPSNLLLLCFPAELVTTMSSSTEHKDFDSNQPPAEDGSTADGSTEDFNQELHRTMHPTTVLGGNPAFSGDTAPGSLHFEEGLFLSSSVVDDAETPPLPAFLRDTQIREALARANNLHVQQHGPPVFSLSPSPPQQALQTLPDGRGWGGGVSRRFPSILGSYWVSPSSCPTFSALVASGVFVGVPDSHKISSRARVSFCSSTHEAAPATAKRRVSSPITWGSICCWTTVSRTSSNTGIGRHIGYSISS
jgi:hypothetical protein